MPANLFSKMQSLLTLLFVCFACTHKNPAMPGPVFSDVPVSVSISPGHIDEASGMADSKANPGYLWIEQDSGNPNDIALLSYSGNILKTINIKTAINRDCEDI